MIYVLILAHLIGDYLLQGETIARWKAKSLLGVVAHGGIVTLTTLVCTALVDASWWPWALLIGVTHTGIDLIRAHFLRTPHPTWQLVWYLLDQAAHLAIAVLAAAWSGSLGSPGTAGPAGFLANPRILAYVTGYLLLANPAWVLLRFTVRGVWGIEAAPGLAEGEKYGPMLERLLIATCTLFGQIHLVPLLLLPRRMTPLRVQGRGVGVLLQPPEHYAETILSTLLAVAVGLVLRGL